MTLRSVYQLFGSDFRPKRQHFWDFFDGNDLKSIWRKETVLGSPTFAMNDAVDGGFKITVDAVASAHALIDFNDIRFLDPTTKCTIIGSHQRIDNDCIEYLGMFEDASNGNTHAAWQENDHPNDSFIEFRTADSAVSSSNSSIPIEIGVWRDTEISIENSNSGTLTIDGILEVTRTTQIPNSKLQPVFRNFRRGGGSPSTLIRYIEAFNT